MSAPKLSPHRNRVFSIEGRELSYPTRFSDGSSMMGLFLVETGPLASQLSSSAFVPAEVAPGRSVLTVVCVHYTDTDCGNYDEIAFGCFVRPHGVDPEPGHFDTIRSVVRGEVPSFTWRLAVNSVLSRDAGLRMWGFPKTTEELRFRRSDGRATMTWRDGDAEVFRFSMPDRGSRATPEISPPVYSMFEGTPHVGHLTQSYTGVGHHPGRGRIELGDHPVAEELRALGLPKRPVLATWSERLDFSMGAPMPLGPLSD